MEQESMYIEHKGEDIDVGRQDVEYGFEPRLLALLLTLWIRVADMDEALRIKTKTSTSIIS